MPREWRLKNSNSNSPQSVKIKVLSEVGVVRMWHVELEDAIFLARQRPQGLLVI
jgi:hypothetical protein